MTFIPKLDPDCDLTVEYTYRLPKPSPELLEQTRKAAIEFFATHEVRLSTALFSAALREGIEKVGRE